MRAMTERRILTLKNPPKPPPASWKCKPCGALFTTPEQGDEKGDVRCPGCNARLGPWEDVAANPPRTDKLRARKVKTAVKAPPFKEPAAGLTTRRRSVPVQRGPKPGSG